MVDVWHGVTFIVRNNTDVKEIMMSIVMCKPIDSDSDSDSELFIRHYLPSN